MLTQFSPENLKGRSHSEYLIVDEIIILKCMLQKYARLWTEMIWFITETNNDALLNVNEIPGSIKSGEFCDYLSD